MIYHFLITSNYYSFMKTYFIFVVRLCVYDLMQCKRKNLLLRHNEVEKIAPNNM